MTNAGTGFARRRAPGAYAANTNASHPITFPARGFETPIGIGSTA